MIYASLEKVKGIEDISVNVIGRYIMIVVVVAVVVIVIVMIDKRCSGLREL